MPYPVHIHNGHSNANIVGTYSNTLRGSQNDTAGEGGRVLQLEELLVLRRPERVATYPFS